MIRAMRHPTAIAAASAILILIGMPAVAARLTPAAAAGFARYASEAEARIRARQASETVLGALAIDTAREGELLNGKPLIEPVNGTTRALPGALLHHWRAAAFVPGASASRMLALLRDYDHLSSYYSPQIISSRALEDHGGTARIAVRFREEEVVTIVLDAEYQVESGLAGARRGFSFSRSAHIFEVDSPGTRRERRRKEGDDEGFLWRLNSYWTFAEFHEGLLIECEAISLTRDIPLGLGWLIAPIVEEFPRQMLEFTLNATKIALMKEAH